MYMYIPTVQKNMPHSKSLIKSIVFSHITQKNHICLKKTLGQKVVKICPWYLTNCRSCRKIVTQFHNLTLDAIEHIICQRSQYQKIAIESPIIKIDSHIIPHYKAYLVYYMFSSHILLSRSPCLNIYLPKEVKGQTPSIAYDLWPFDMNPVEYGQKQYVWDKYMLGRKYQL